MKELRKRIWIDPFQTGLLVRIVVYLCLYQVVAWCVFSICDYLNAAYAVSGAEVLFLKNTLGRSLLVLLILLPPLAVDSVRFAHRVVGPLYRFRKIIQAIAAGEQVALVQLREGDLLVDFQNDFNAMLKHLEKQGYVLLKMPEKAVNPETTPAPDCKAPGAAHPGA